MAYPVSNTAADQPSLGDTYQKSGDKAAPVPRARDHVTRGSSQAIHARGIGSGAMPG
ncbi:hypothetical protein IWW55_007290, partial [Coemansia sp. RSA 2706]